MAIARRIREASACPPLALRAESARPPAPARWLRMLLLAAAWQLVWGGGWAAAASPLDPTSGADAREESLRAIPWDALNQQQRRAVSHVVQHASIYRRLPTRVIDCDAELFTFLAQHPEVMVEIWRAMGISKVVLEQLGNASYKADDGAGTIGKFTFLDAAWGEHAFNKSLVYASGSYVGGPIATPVSARCVLLMRSGSVKETNGRRYVTVRMDAFVSVEQVAADLIARTIRPLLTTMADRNFNETMNFVGSFSRAAERNPSGVERFSESLTALDPKTRAALVREVYETSARYAEIRRQRGESAMFEGSELGVQFVGRGDP